MTKAIPTVSKFMSTNPHSIGRDQTLAKASHMMREYNIRHLPVLDGGRLAGIITARDIALVETLRDVNPDEVTVEDAMSEDVYTVSPDAPLDEVVGEMASRKYGSAVVMHNQKVVGIYTTVDVCSTLSDLLHTRLSK